MALEPIRRQKWAIDRALDGLISADIRVAAKAFSPTRWTGEEAARLLPVRQLILPDNSQPDGLPVFFEGRLRQFERQIGVVFAWLDPPTTQEETAEGVVCFRGQTTVIVRGPALVELAFPFQVERLPTDSENYWRDLRLPRAQFELPFPAPAVDEKAGPEPRLADPRRCLAPGPPTLSEASSPPIVPERRSPPVDLPSSNAVDQNTGLKAMKEEPCRSQPGPNQTPIRNLNCLPSTR